MLVGSIPKLGTLQAFHWMFHEYRHEELLGSLHQYWPNVRLHIHDMDLLWAPKERDFLETARPMLRSLTVSISEDAEGERKIKLKLIPVLKRLENLEALSITKKRNKDSGTDWSISHSLFVPDVVVRVLYLD